MWRRISVPLELSLHHYKRHGLLNKFYWGKMMFLPVVVEEEAGVCFETDVIISIINYWR